MARQNVKSINPNRAIRWLLACNDAVACAGTVYACAVVIAEAAIPRYVTGGADLDRSVGIHRFTGVLVVVRFRGA